MSQASPHGCAGGEPRPRSFRDLQGRFQSYDYAPEQLPRRHQGKMLLRLLDVYERLGLLRDERPAPLCQICPNAKACWASAEAKVRREPPDDCGEDNEDGSVCLPWVGPEYRAGGVVVLGINPHIAPGKRRHDYTDLLIEHSITWNHYVANFSRGIKAEGGSRFAFASMRSAAALLDVLDKKPVRARRPKELLDPVMRVARLQAIKCVPRRESSKPFPEMWERCPPLVLGDELDVLRPGILLALGEKPAGAVAQLRGFQEKRADAPRVCRGLIQRARWAADVYMLPHPRASAVNIERSFLRALKTKPPPG